MKLNFSQRLVIGAAVAQLVEEEAENMKRPSGQIHTDERHDSIKNRRNGRRT